MTSNPSERSSGRDHRIDFLRGVALAMIFINHVPGMQLSAVYARRAEQGLGAYTYANADLNPVVAETQAALDTAIERGNPVVAADAMLLCRTPHLDALIDVASARIRAGDEVPSLRAWLHRVASERRPGWRQALETLITSSS